MYEQLTTLISGITVIFAIFGIFLFVKLLSTWRNINPEIIKARVFLAEKFVIKNIWVIFIVGILIGNHNFIEYLGLGHPEFYYNNLAAKYPTRLFAVTELLVALLLVEWLMLQWINIAKQAVQKPL